MKRRIPRISITGIDGCGKSSSIDVAINNGYLKGFNIIFREVPINHQCDDFFRWIEDWIERIYLEADKHNNKFIPAIGYTLTTLLGRPIFLYRSFLDKRENIDAVVNHRDSVIDAVAYSMIYWGWVDRILPLSLQDKIKLLEKILREDLPDVLIYLEIDPGIAIKRIDKRIKEGSKKSARHFHESEETLLVLQDLHKKTIEAATQIKEVGMKVFYLDAEEPVEEVGGKVSQIILDSLEKN